jgi:hypothetical protein
MMWHSAPSKIDLRKRELRREDEAGARVAAAPSGRAVAGAVRGKIFIDKEYDESTSELNDI